ncbi:DUF6506 family protein [Aquicella lusitana]|uniref:Uncharacterized protein n=1 Tax=Aquicella lusitana TaxID=254246 RepID=A0A370GAP3_9COXI|nr:DUF6506 family protein [Aquicella lusitana]RDI39063.1 hypothetical protein C8D86_12919 [Aquicella lusitana]VVC73670.1 hypothetical protein AQULUS_14170 [Aquicella lusitana]
MNKAGWVSIVMGLMSQVMAPPLHAETVSTQPVINQSGKHATMKFNNFIYIFLGPELDPKQHRAVIKTDKLTYTTVGIDFKHKEKVIEVAKEAVANGAQMIELCGGFGPLWIAKVTEAIQGKVPVGSVAYGPEARKPLVDLLS